MANEAFVPRSGPSGPDMPTSTPGYVLTVQADGASVAAEPLAEGTSGIGQYSASDATNVFDTSASADFVALTGPSFIETTAGDGLTLTAEGCVVTYNGSVPQRFSVRLAMSINQLSPGGNATAFIGVDHAGNLIGQAPLLTFPGIELSLLDADGNAFFVSTERVLVLAPGETIQPVLALVAVAPGTEVSISRLSMVVQPVR